MSNTVKIIDGKKISKIANADLSNFSKGLRKTSIGVHEAKDSLEDTIPIISRFDKRIQKTKQILSNWMNHSYEFILGAKDKATPVYGLLKDKLSSLGGKTWSVILKAVDQTSSTVAAVEDQVKSFASKAGEFFEIDISFKDTVSVFAEFEAAMSRVKVLSKATSGEFADLTEKAEHMGQTTTFTAAEIADGFQYMAQSGWKTRDMLAGIDAVASLAAISGQDLGETSQLLAEGLDAFGLKASESGRFADVLAAAAVHANMEISEMANIFKEAGSGAGALGYGFKDVSLAAGLMLNSGMDGAKVGSSLNLMFTRIAGNTGGASDAIRKLGVELYNSDGSARRLSDVMGELRKSTAGMSEEQKKSLANTIAGKEAHEGLLAVLNASEEDYSNLSHAIRNTDGVAEDMADTMTDNLQGAFMSLQHAADGIKISLGERLKPYLEALTNWLTDQMPYIEQGLMQFMNFVDARVVQMKAKIGEFTKTAEWKNAGLFGKIEIAWDELIGKPFGTWWDSKGKELFAKKAQSLGMAVGSGVSGGLLALFGADISDALNEGGAVGAAFVKGLLESLNVKDIGAKFMQVIGSVFSNAAKILPGGEAMDLSSVLSTALIAKAGVSLFKRGRQGYQLGRTIWNGFPIGGSAGGNPPDGGPPVAQTFGLKNVIGSYSLSGESKGLIGAFGNIGMFLGSTASTSAGMVAAGAGSVAGAAVAAGALFSSFEDLKKSFLSDDAKEASAYASAGIQEFSGVAIGALAGSLFGPIGTMVGAGLGGFAGIVMGKNTKENYAKELQKAAEEAKKLEVAEKQAKYESKEMKEAIQAVADGTMASAEAAQIFEKAVGNNLKDHFGDIKLSMQEIQDLAQKLVFGDQADALTKFADASEAAKHSYAALQDSMLQADKLNWKAGLGTELSDTEKEEYKTGLGQMSSNAQSYIEDQHYEATSAFKLLKGDGFTADMADGLNQTYTSLKEQVNGYDKQLQEVLETALSDGVISDDNKIKINLDGMEIEMGEQEAVLELQSRITGITDSMSNADAKARLDAAKIKHGGAGMDAESFLQLQAETQSYVEAATQSYDEALVAGIKSLNLQLEQGEDHGGISQDDYQAQMEALQLDYEKNISGVHLEAENFQLDAIAEAYTQELEAAFEGTDGTISEILRNRLYEAIKGGEDVTTWDSETAASWLGIENLSEEAKENIAEMMSGLAEAIPQSVQEELKKYSLSNLFSDSVIFDYEDGNLMGSMAASMIGGLTNSLQKTDMEELNSAAASLKQSADNAVTTAFEAGVNTKLPVNVTANYKLANPTASISFSGGGTGQVQVAASISSNNVAKNANGNIITSPILSWVGEDGPEAIIPLGEKRRSRGISLWQQAGEMLGVLKHANGGIVGVRSADSGILLNPALSYFGQVLKLSPDGETDSDSGSMSDDNPNHVPLTVGRDMEGSGGKEIKVEVNLSPAFEIRGNENSASDIVRIIKANMKELADEIGGELAHSLESVFSNMPVKGGA